MLKHRLPAVVTIAVLVACKRPNDTATEILFPDVYTPQTDLEPYEEVRWETETWDPLVDLDQTALYLEKAALHRPSAPIEELQHFDLMRPQIPPLDGRRPTLSFVGDIMWLGSHWDAFALPVADHLDGALRVGNLETPTSPGDSTEPRALGLYAFNSPPAILDGLPLDVVQLTNNHALDAGDHGLEATMAEVEARGMRHTGVDTQDVEEVDGKRIALLAYTWGVNQRPPNTTHDLHIIPFGHLDEEIDLSTLQYEVEEARAGGADSVVVLVHWGYEYEYYADPHFLVLGRQIIAAGADLVVGEGPHVVQPPEICTVNDPDVAPGIGRCSVQTEDGAQRQAAIVYSLGNFATTMATAPCQAGIIASVVLDPDVKGLGWEAIATVDTDEGPTLEPLEALGAEWAAERTRLDAHLGTSWKR